MNSIKAQLPFFGLIKVSGEDATTFLHNQLSNDILNLPLNGACYACYNTPQGRVIANMLVLKTSDNILLFMAKNLCEKVTNRLRMYVLRSKTTLEQSSDYFLEAHLETPHKQATAPTTALPCFQKTENTWQIQLPHGGYYQLIKNNGLHLSAKTNSEGLYYWQKHEINNGYAWICAATSEKCVAQMLNLHETGAINFKKGCYPGQEIIARAQYRGQVRRGLASFNTPIQLTEGENLFNQDGEEIGIVMNSASNTNENIALAVIKHSSHDAQIYARQHKLKMTNIFFTPNKEG